MRKLLLVACVLASGRALALPIGFGVNQGDLEYDEIKSDHFIVYHDRRVPGEGALVLNSLEAARPHLERWFGVERKTPLPVVMSAVTDNASFADFITDALELQTMGQGGRDLAWHEYTHSTMYRDLDNWFGPAGNILHLPWMPAWFLEGLADTMSVSVGSDWMAGIERYQALTGDWPTYDRLHSLYTKAGFALRGYATSAAIVRYLLKKGDPAKLPQLLDDFYHYSMPWWWPYTIVPYAESLPMDRALRNFCGMNGEELYEAYKKDAAAYWKNAAKAPFLAEATKAARKEFNSVNGLRSDGREIQHLTMIDDVPWEVSVEFDAGTGWATGWKKKVKLLDEKSGYARLSGKSLKAAVRYEKDGPEDVSYVTSKAQGDKKATTLKREGTIFSLHEGPTQLVWLEQENAHTRLCTKPKKGGKVSCSVKVAFPESLRALGEKERAAGSGVTDELWLVFSQEKLRGTRYEVAVYDVRAGTLRRNVMVSQARPVSVAFAGKDTWVLLAERNERTLRRIDAAGQCVGMIALKDHALDLLGLDDGSLVVGLYAGDKAYVKKLTQAERAEVPCSKPDGQASPILYAVRKGGDVDLKAAIAGAELWTAEPPAPTPEEERAFAAQPSGDKDMQPDTGSQTESKPARWRGRSLFLFPWIGADDALGSQIGVVSVPLMDNMQNETVRATFLYGIESNFPYSEVAVTSTRFRPTLTLAGYRQQTYNGRFQKLATGEVFNSYLDEEGARFESSTDFRALGGALSFGAGMKYAHLRPYIGPSFNGRGWLAEPAASVGMGHAVGNWTFSNSLSGRVAPEQLNDDFDYNQVGAATSVGYALPFWQSKTTAGLEGSRTRGKKKRDFNEMYRPLKTFVPGSGGGYNQNSFPLAGEGSGLFSPVFGDTQARAKVNWTVPVVREVDKLFWIIYAERLDFTAFYNYGAAWSGPEPRVGWDKLLRAHGYSLDLQMENKGVRFNAGLGTGQVVGKSFEVFVTTGFDALF